MLLWFSRLPLTLRLPLLVAAMIFVAAVVTTQVAVQSTSDQFESEIERLGQVYLDGLSAAVMPAVAAEDLAAMTAVLQRALTVHVGIEDRELAILDAKGSVVARASRPGPSTAARNGAPAGPAEVAGRLLPAPVGAAGAGTVFDVADRSVWIWRPLPLVDTSIAPATLIANLDISSFLEERQQLRWTLLLFDLLLSAVCAALGFILARQIQRPVALLTEHLVQAEADLPQPVARELIPAHDPQTARLISAYNRMADNASQREAMLGRLVDQERDAVLGRMAATLAHEIRNPLGGMAAAIQTLRKFGDQEGARAEAVDFIARGVVALQEVTDATLKTHRPMAAMRLLRLQDLHDVGLLVRADAASRQVGVELDVDVPDEVAVPATAVRQLLLNLLLNAVRATAPGGTVTLRARRKEEMLLLEVIDQGPGLAPEMVNGMTSGIAPPGNPGLGVAVIVRLVERLQGQVSVVSRSHGGTQIALRLPLAATGTAPEEQADGFARA